MHLPHAELREHASALARAAAWGEIVSLLDGHSDDGAGEIPELAALRAESLLRTGRPRDARACLELAMAAPALQRERPTLRRATNLLGAAQFALGELEAARRAFEQALEMGRADDDDLLVARATNNLGAIANIRGDREQALALYHLAVPVYQRLGSALGLAQSFHNIAITFRDLGQLDRADEYERRAIEYARQGGSEHLAALARLGRADINLRKGDAMLAEAGARHVAKSFAALGDAINQADALRLCGAASLARGDVEAARVALDVALQLARARGSALHEAEALRTRAELARARGDAPGARADAEAAIGVFQQLGAAEDAERLYAWLHAGDRRS